MPWTAEQWRAKRAAACKSNHATALPASVAETGRELQAMIDCPARDWPTSKWGRPLTVQEVMRKVEHGQV